jgi:hypothetical protein
VPAAARARASSQPMPWRAAVARQERIAQKIPAPRIGRMQPETLIRSLAILMTCSAGLLPKGTRRSRAKRRQPDSRAEIREARAHRFFCGAVRRPAFSAVPAAAASRNQRESSSRVSGPVAALPAARAPSAAFSAPAAPRSPAGPR